MVLDLTSMFRPELLTPTFLAQQKEVKDKATSRAIEKGVAPNEKELVRRDLLPEDVGFTTNEWAKTVTLSSAGEFEYINTTLGDNDYVVIVGAAIQDVSTRASYIAFDTGAGRKAIYDLNKAYVQKEPIILFSTPIKYEPNQKMIVKVYGLTTGTDVNYKIQLLGYKIEPFGKKISPPTKT